MGIHKICLFILSQRNATFHKRGRTAHATVIISGTIILWKKHVCFVADQHKTVGFGVFHCEASFRKGANEATAAFLLLLERINQSFFHGCHHLNKHSINKNKKEHNFNINRRVEKRKSKMGDLTVEQRRKSDGQTLYVRLQ